MTVGPIQAYSAYQPYAPINTATPSRGLDNTTAAENVGNTKNANSTENTENTKKAEKAQGKAECETCATRKYMDGSNEADVSFKSATHVSSSAAASAVRSHEQMHVANAYQKAETDNGKVISAHVAIHTSICPECGRTYVAGGTTTTQIRYYNEDNPYQKDLKAQQESVLAGANVNYAI